MTKQLGISFLLIAFLLPSIVFAQVNSKIVIADSQISNSDNSSDISASNAGVVDMVMDSIIIDYNMCEGNDYPLIAVLINNGTAMFSDTVPMGYQFGTGGSISLGIALIQNLNPGDTFFYSPSNHLVAQNAGVHSLKVGFYLPSDSDHSNDTANTPVFVDTYPLVNLPHDTSINGNQSILLDPGSGYDSYLWYNNDTTSTITVDSTGIGYGSVAAWVEVTNGICVNTDTTVITFMVYQSVENTIENKSISVYPNPSADFIIIESELTGINLVNVFNIDGKLISTFKINRNDRIDITNLPKGIYYLHFNTEQGTITRKIVKQ